MSVRWKTQRILTLALALIFLFGSFSAFAVPVFASSASWEFVPSGTYCQVWYVYYANSKFNYGEESDVQIPVYYCNDFAYETGIKKYDIPSDNIGLFDVGGVSAVDLKTMLSTYAQTSGCSVNGFFPRSNTSSTYFKTGECPVGFYLSNSVITMYAGGRYQGGLHFANGRVFYCIDKNGVIGMFWVGADFYYTASRGESNEYLFAEIPPSWGIDSIDLSQSPSVCYAGSRVYLTIVINGSGDYNDSVTCTLSGASSSGTYIGHEDNDVYSNIYYVEVGEDETSSSVLVTVVSDADSSKSATHKIDILPDSSSTATSPSTPECEEPIPTEDNPTEPGEDSGENTEGDNEKEEAVGEGNTSVDDLTEVIPDYSEGFIQALQNFAGAMSYTGTEAKLKIPAVMFPQLGNLVPGFQMMDEVELDFEMYVGMMPDNLMTLVRALFTVALIVYCFKEFYGLIAYALTLKGGIA